MTTLATATKQNTTTTANRQNASKNGSLMLKRKSNGQDTETLSQLVSTGSPTNSYYFSADTYRNSHSGHLSHLVHTSAVQTKLTVGKPNNRFEQEADQMAEKVMTAPSPSIQSQEDKEEESVEAKLQAFSIQRQAEEEEGEEVQAKLESPTIQCQEEEKEEGETIQTKPLIQNQSKEEKEEEVQTKPLIQKQEDKEEEPVEAKLQAFSIQRQAEEEEREEVQAKLESPTIQCQEEEKEEGETIQTKPLIQNQSKEEKEEEVQTKPLIQKQEEEKEEPIQAKGGPKGTVNTGLQSQLRSTKASGYPLSDSIRSFMEPRFSSDFSNVRIHTDSTAVHMSRELGAQAFTHGSDIYFNESKYAPGSTQGNRLLAHELSHTIQQGASPPLQISLMPKPVSILRQEEAEKDVDLEAELAASEEEAIAATDPGPAETARKEATKEKEEKEKEKEGPEERPEEEKEKEVPEEELKEKKAKPPVIEGDKAEKEEKGETGEYLEQQSAHVCGEAAAKVQVLAENEQTYDDAEQKLTQTEEAVEPPAEEGQAQSNAEQVNELDQTPAPEPDEKKAKDELNSAIEQSVPRTIEGMNEFKSRGKAKVIGNKVLGKVKEDTDAVNASYNAIETAPPAKPPEKIPQELPEIEEAPETPELNLGENAVPGLKEEHTDFSKYDKESDEIMEKEGISGEQLEMVDSGDLLEAKKERKELKTKVKEEPAKIKEFSQQQTQKVDQDLKQEEQKARIEMSDKRTQELTNTKEKQKKTKSALELKREAVTKKINGIYEKAKKSVTIKLNNLEEESLITFDREQAEASQDFEYDVNRDVDKWKRKRYSGFWGPAKWIKDKFYGIDDFPEVKRAFDNARVRYIKRIDQLILQITKENQKVIKDCKDELAAAREEIKQYVDSLGPELKATGQQAMQEMKAKLDEMDKFIDQKKEALAKKLCAKKEEAIKKIDEKIEKMKEEMSGLLSKLGNFLLEALLKFFKWALEKFGCDANQLMSIINKGKAVIKKIVSAPIEFIKNIIKAVKDGINNFVANIKGHLVGGLINWLTGAMGDIDIQLPAKFDLKGILSIVLQILGLTWNIIRQKLVKRVGEKVVSGIEKTVDIVKRIITEGPMALWNMIKEKAEEIKQQVMEGIRNWAIVELVKQGIIKLLSFLTPAGAIVQAILAIYNTIMFFVENWNRIVQFVKTVFSSIADIAMGKLSAASAAIEKAMAMTIPIILSFLARLLNLSGIGKAIKNIIMKIRKPIDKVVDNALDFIVKKGRALFARGKATAKKAVEKVKELIFPKKRFNVGKETHTIEAIKSGNSYRIMIHSNSMGIEEFIVYVKKQGKSVSGLEEKLTQLKLDYNNWSKMPISNQAQIEKKGKKYRNILSSIEDIWKKLPNKENIPVSEISWGSLSEGRATSVVANPLTIKGIKGSPPQEPIPGWYSKTIKGLPKIEPLREISNIRAHLLHHKLHGPGRGFNLTPTSTRFNRNQMYPEAEEHALKALGIIAGAKVVTTKLKYVTKVEYGDSYPAPLKYVAKSISVEVYDLDNKKKIMPDFNEENYSDSDAEVIIKRINKAKKSGKT